MKWIAWLVVMSACQTGDARQAPSQKPGTGDGSSVVISLPKAPVTAEYRADITSLCDALQQSGAMDHPADERWQVVAMWLGPHITTDAGHEFLVAIQPLQGAAKAAALDSEAHRVGLSKCDLANEWRK